MACPPHWSANQHGVKLWVLEGNWERNGEERGLGGGGRSMEAFFFLERMNIPRESLQRCFFTSYFHVFFHLPSKSPIPHICLSLPASCLIFHSLTLTSLLPPSVLGDILTWLDFGMTAGLFLNCNMYGLNWQQKIIRLYESGLSLDYLIYARICYLDSNKKNIYL